MCLGVWGCVVPANCWEVGSSHSYWLFKGDIFIGWHSFRDMLSTYFLKVNLGSLDLRVGVDTSGVSVGLVTSD